MSLLRINRAFVSVASRVQVRAAPAVAARRMSSDIEKKESAQERDFVARQERDTLRRMLSKMEADADPGHKKALAALEAKLAAQGVRVTEQMKKDMLAWKNTAH